MKVVTVLGARPQFIKAAVVSRQLKKNHTEIIIHTGQHYDANMSEIFFEELHIPKPDYNLGVGSSSHGKQTGEMLAKIEEILLKVNPDYMLVYGDTNSTLAGALAAAKLLIPVVHVEAGLRSFNKRMPEEQNRIMTDHLSDLLFCPTETAVRNLKQENIIDNVFNVGDVMFDAVEFNRKLAESRSNVLEQHHLVHQGYHLITVHRAENTNDPEKLSQVVKALSSIETKKVWPLHPRTKQALHTAGLDLGNIPNLVILPPVGYLDMLQLESHAGKILTDSGGVQKEAYFMKVPCITLREETEWVETLQDQANILTGTDAEKIRTAESAEVDPQYRAIFGDTHAAEKIVKHLENRLRDRKEITCTK